MRVRLLMGAMLALACASCAGSSAPPPTTAESATIAGQGASVETAIVLEDAKTESEGIRAEHVWVKEHLPGWSWETQAVMYGPNGHVYDRIALRKGAASRELYFDITDWFGKL